MLYLPSFLVAFAVTVAIILFFLGLPALPRGHFRRAERHRVGRSLLRLGGVAMILGFAAAVLLDQNLVLTREIIGLLAGLGVVLLFGLWDDLTELDWKTQIVFQLGLAIIVFLFGVRILSLTTPWGGAWFFPTEAFHFWPFLILLGWLMLVINSMNWLDGLDGLSGGVTFIALLSIFFLSLKPEVNQPPLAILAAAGFGATLGFLLFNVHPARVLAGTAGSVFMGFLVAILAVLAGTKIATALLVLSLPIADALYVLYSRYRAKAPLFLPDRRHLHYQLAALGWREGQIAFLFFGLTALIALIALSTETLGKFAALLLVLLIIFSLIYFVDRRVRKQMV